MWTAAWRRPQDDPRVPKTRTWVEGLENSETTIPQEPQENENKKAKMWAVWGKERRRRTGGPVNGGLGRRSVGKVVHGRVCNEKTSKNKQRCGWKWENTETD